MKVGIKSQISQSLVHILKVNYLRRKYTCTYMGNIVVFQKYYMLYSALLISELRKSSWISLLIQFHKSQRCIRPVQICPE